MMTTRRLLVAAVLCCAAPFLVSAAVAQTAPPDTARIEQLTGLKGTLNAKEAVFKVTFHSTDIQAAVAGTRMVPDLGLTG